ncbi:MAG: Gfo/Idh/MocA family oxidoreductase [Pseudomonadota bacterium]
MPRPLRIGTLGAARITPTALLHPAWAIGQVKVPAVAARDRARAEAFAAAHSIPRVLDDYAALIADPDLDAIYNPLPIDQHAPWTIAALEAGKHVLCEKPFAMNAGEARAMLAAAETSGKRLVEAFHYRYHTAFETCLNWVRTGTIGQIQHIDAAFNVHIRDKDGQEIRHRPENGGGAMMDLGCYPVSWVLMLMDEAPVDVTAEARLTPSGVDERFAGTLGFASGASANVSCDMGPGAAVRMEMTVTGSDGTIAFVNPLAPHMGATVTLKRAGREDETHTASLISTYTFQLAAFVSAIATDGPPLPTEGTQVIERQQETLDRLYTAAGLAHLRETDAGA